MFEEQYNELFQAVDEIAERIRALGYPAPGSYKSFSKLSSIKEAKDKIPAKQMIQELLEGQEILIRTFKSWIFLFDTLFTK